MDKILLVSPPGRVPDEGCLALATLRPILEERGIVCDELHGSQLYPHTETSQLFLSSYSAHLFVPQLTPEVDHEQVLDTIVDRFVDDLNLQGLVKGSDVTLADLGRDEQAVRDSLQQEIENARVCIERCVAHATRPDVDIVGFSVTFETQLPAALAIARRLKATNPRVTVIFGGAACFHEVADAIATSFRDVDIVCHCEGEHVIVELVRAIREQSSLADVAGITWVDDDGQLHHSPEPPPINNLDDLPEPTYDAFVNALANSEWGELQPKLFFEMSRGCWWGEHGPCAFCGLNSSGLGYRRKSPVRAFEEIQTLYLRYPTARRLQATDNILDRSFVDQTLPLLRNMERQPNRPLRLFVEAKTNLSKPALHAFAAAGIDLVQPGIESFSDDVLKLMNKGATGLGQIRFIKWATEAGLWLTYNLLVRNPGEKAHWYREMTELVPFIEHLPPPSNVTPTWLERFSPYHTSPGRFGITNLRHKDYYRGLFPDVPVHLDDLAYVFDYDHAMLADVEITEALRNFVLTVGQWQRDWKPGQAYYQKQNGAVHIVDRRVGFERTAILEGVVGELFLYLDRVRSRLAMATRFSGVDIDRHLNDLRENRWVCSDSNGRYLAVLPANNSA